MAAEPDLYRVVGVRADGSRHTLSVRLPMDDVVDLRDRLLSAGIFAEILIEAEEQRRRSIDNRNQGTR